LGRLSNLKKLILAEVNLPFWPFDYGATEKYELLPISHINIGGNTVLQNLPVGLSKFVNLTWLCANFCQFKGCIPSWISNLVQLRRLTLDHNQFEELPESLTTMTNLQCLNIESNVLNSLESLQTMTFLRRLSCSGNRGAAVITSDALYRAEFEDDVSSLLECLRLHDSP